MARETCLLMRTSSPAPDSESSVTSVWRPASHWWEGGSCQESGVAEVAVFRDAENRSRDQTPVPGNCRASVVTLVRNMSSTEGDGHSLSSAA